MYLNVGNGKYVKKKNIIGIFDMDTATISSLTRSNLRRAEKEGRVLDMSMDIPKSFLLYKEGERESILLCKLSSTVLMTRAQSEGGAAVEEEDEEENT